MSSSHIMQIGGLPKEIWNLIGDDLDYENMCKVRILCKSLYIDTESIIRRIIEHCDRESCIARAMHLIEYEEATSDLIVWMFGTVTARVPNRVITVVLSDPDEAHNYDDYVNLLSAAYSGLSIINRESAGKDCFSLISLIAQQCASVIATFAYSDSRISAVIGMDHSWHDIVISYTLDSLLSRMMSRTSMFVTAEHLSRALLEYLNEHHKAGNETCYPLTINAASNFIEYCSE